MSDIVFFLVILSASIIVWLFYIMDRNYSNGIDLGKSGINDDLADREKINYLFTDLFYQGYLHATSKERAEKFSLEIED